MTGRPEIGGGQTLLESPSPAEPLPAIPGYEVLSELGRGGMGVVYRARQLSPSRLVALKLIRDSVLAGPQERGRFQIEAEAAARVQHPNVVAVYDVGSHQGHPYFAMELVEGGSLADQLKGESQPPRDAAALVSVLALAVHSAHEQKIVHRDLKPANILLERSVPTTEVPWTPKIADFGLAKRLDSNSTAWTMDGALLGTASYMAPEQAAGRANEVGPPADIYSLGAILYELLTGRPPFVADSAIGIVEQVLHAEPVRLTQLLANVPADLETICLKCLEKSPAARYADAAELAGDLDRFLSDVSIAASAIDPFERLVRCAARDGYQIGDEIGRGPRSVVYRGLATATKHGVAIKVFHDGALPEASWQPRMQAAAQQWASLSHPQILLPLTIRWWDGRGCVVIDHVPQGDLTTVSRWSIRQSLKVVEQLSEVVGYLHRQGVAHGNIKRTNVLLAPSGIPLLIDLSPIGGLSLLPRAEVDHASVVSRLAPEQIDARDAEPGFATDIYGMGMVLYELLTGRTPFIGETVAEVLEQIRSAEPVAPSTFNSDVSPALDAFCRRCLQKNPARRYFRVYDVTARLKALQNDQHGKTVRRRKPM
ncbi:Serine/threonine-protein kinase PknB [Caulifigura coniformis]|uniref:Serine/threonine-protein kinase PknB n=1 Tax=Caulifigura coniformis TaxID=2527983 RepID=A0A517SJ36_9PLAN|nr:serine/threonine-protein kinase [Caulifigura coniformis]QDT56137.1 Serine/threonine-protein kinase PknB [Caulifigura coniformis]